MPYIHSVHWCVKCITIKCEISGKRCNRDIVSLMCAVVECGGGSICSWEPRPLFSCEEGSGFLRLGSINVLHVYNTCIQFDEWMSGCSWPA